MIVGYSFAGSSPLGLHYGRPRITFATWDPLTTNNQLTLSNGNLTATRNGVAPVPAFRSVLSTIGKTSGRWSWELTYNGANTNGHLIGAATPALLVTEFPGSAGAGRGVGYQPRNGAGPLGWSAGAPFASVVNMVPGDVITWIADLDFLSHAAFINGVPEGSGLGGTAPQLPYFAALGLFDAGDGMTANFGQSPFAFPGVVPPGYNIGLFTFL